MRRLLIPFLLITATAHGDDVAEPAAICRDLSLVAKKVMTARQKDDPKLETHATATDRLKDWSDQYGFGFSIEDAKEGAAALVLDAYEKTLMAVNQDQKRAIDEFAKHSFEVCVKQMTARASGVE